MLEVGVKSWNNSNRSHLRQDLVLMPGSAGKGTKVCVLLRKLLWHHLLFYIEMQWTRAWVIHWVGMPWLATSDLCFDLNHWHKYFILQLFLYSIMLYYLLSFFYRLRISYCYHISIFHSKDTRARFLISFTSSWKHLPFLMSILLPLLMPRLVLTLLSF